ncbi:hypothetical protein O181_046309 [Austropuccinia psidii MF-1]|uniref:Uncharacterized protein n=1 Tax=Austropuccinia psidii MF-1 TaxID=1389203 RepID=A0A9Q3DNU6_9BASI|nr:hypothetical protein [Austropuccinia psidii MF-1]
MYITYNLPQALITLGAGNLWPCCLGHLGHTGLKNLGLPDQERSSLPCKINKARRLPFLHDVETARYPLDTVHIDVVGPITTESSPGSGFLLTIVDKATSFKIIKFHKGKSDSFNPFVITKTIWRTGTTEN